MPLIQNPGLKSSYTSDEAKLYAHSSFNQAHHSDVRSERHTYINRECFINALKAESDHLNEQKIELVNISSSDRTDLQHSALDRIDKRMKQLVGDIAVLEESREAHFPHYAFVTIAAAFIDGEPFTPSSDGEGFDAHSTSIRVDEFARGLTLKLIADESITDKFATLDNILANLKSDAERAHDSLDRLISTDNQTRKWQIRNPDLLYAVLIQDPPQTGSAAIRGQTPPTESSPGDDVTNGG